MGSTRDRARAPPDLGGQPHEPEGGQSKRRPSPVAAGIDSLPVQSPLFGACLVQGERAFGSRCTDGRGKVAQARVSRVGQAISIIIVVDKQSINQP